jgi:hypothetical protein
VQFLSKEDLETGVFRVRPSTAKSAVPNVPGGIRAHAPAAEPAASGPAAAPVPAKDWASAAVPSVPHVSGAPHEPVAAAPRRTHPAQRPWLDVDGDRYPLLAAITVLGRDDSADVILDDPGISRQHTEIRVTTDGPHLVASIRDLGSTNGTFVNGERITSQRLADGDRVNMGRTALIFRAGHR